MSRSGASQEAARKSTRRAQSSSGSSQAGVPMDAALDEVEHPPSFVELSAPGETCPISAYSGSQS